MIWYSNPFFPIVPPSSKKMSMIWSMDSCRLESLDLLVEFTRIPLSREGPEFPLIGSIWSKNSIHFQTKLPSWWFHIKLEMSDSCMNNVALFRWWHDSWMGLSVQSKCATRIFLISTSWSGPKCPIPFKCRCSSPYIVPSLRNLECCSQKGDDLAHKEFPIRYNSRHITNIRLFIYHSLHLSSSEFK